MTRTLIIIPAHNEVDSIQGVLQELRREAPGADRLVVNDGSVDGTGELVTRLGERCLHLACNVGYGPALQAGLWYALRRGYDIAVFVDGDGQHSAEDVPRLVAALDEWGCDMVIGSRYGQDRPYVGSFSRCVGQRLFSYLTKVTVGRRIYDTTSGLKAVRASVFRLLIDGTYLDFHTEALVELAIRGYHVRELRVSMRERQHGQSMYSWKSAFEYPLKTMLLTAAGAANALMARRHR
jgi:glycosyltransferase involved in cell wall biosynthesis